MAQSRKMDRFLALGLGVGIAFTQASSAFAAQPRKAVTQEVYSATESETPTAPMVVASAEPIKTHPNTPLRMAPAPKLADVAATYDPVPSNQIDPLGKRLKLVEILIRRYSRAYDYRTHTVKDLATILAKLDAAATPAPKRLVNDTPPAKPLSTAPAESEEDEIEH